MGLQPARTLRDKPVQVVFIGSCTNARLSDLELAAGRDARPQVAPGGARARRTGLAERQARGRGEGLAKVFIDAGAEWRESGCSMCIGMNGDPVEPRPVLREYEQP